MFMGSPDNNKLSEMADIVRSWIPKRVEPAKVSRDFWMPDQSCRVCYECDCQFTIFNRRHHCRVCGRVFCARCTANSVPAPSDEPKTGTSREDWERIRVCNYCFKQWEQRVATVNHGTITASSPILSPSPSSTSLVSTQSSSTCNSSGTVGSNPYSTGSYQHVPHSSSQSPRQPTAQMDIIIDKQDQVICSGKSDSDDARDPFPDQFRSSSRSDDEDDEYRVYRSQTEACEFSPADVCYDEVNYDAIDHHAYRPEEVLVDERNEPNQVSSDLPIENINKQTSEGFKKLEEEDIQNNDTESEVHSPEDEKAMDIEPVDFEGNNLLWLPPEPEDEEDDRETLLYDDNEEGDEVAAGDWGYLRSSSFSGVEYRNKENSSEEYRRAMKNALDGHFKALIAQFLQVENLPVYEDDSQDGWLQIVPELCWEAATFLKPDMSKCGGMDPGGYVKVKCVASGRRRESLVVKGVVCKKNVAHRRMTSKIDKPRFLILGGALEYQRVANHLSSFDTLLQQEMDHLKMAVAKIASHHPSILLVEKSVSRFAQDYLLSRNISLVLNIKRPLLERIARCTGAQIVPSVDHLTSPKLGCCDLFHVDKFLEEHGNDGKGGKKSTKTLMFFEGCPKPLGCTILLKGSSEDELKKVKHVVQYGVFAAYHLALETSFLADEGASLPEFPLKSPIKVALPDRPSSLDKSISMVPGFTVPSDEKPQVPETFGEPYWSLGKVFSDIVSPNILPEKSAPSEVSCSIQNEETASNNLGTSDSVSSLSNQFWDAHQAYLYTNHDSDDKDKVAHSGSSDMRTSVLHIADEVKDGSKDFHCSNSLEALPQVGFPNESRNAFQTTCSISDFLSLDNDDSSLNEDLRSQKEEFPPSPSDHQSILVSLSSRSVWKGTVCERAHLFRIKYYGSFDKPLGRFLRDHLFDQSYCCRSCEMPSEAHVHSYTHQQGSLTISIKKFPAFILPGEREGKIWMWHRCMRCPRVNGYPPATKRVIMSDAAWGLSFGKFLELSFSNHAAASRVASCGHSLHRDCLRFYGYGRMVACFRYAPICVHAVVLPPPKLEFNYDKQEWTQNEADKVRTGVNLLLAEVSDAMCQIEKISHEKSVQAPEFAEFMVEFEALLQKENNEFQESLQNVFQRKSKVGQPALDILEINRLRRQLIFYAYLCDKRFINLRSLINKKFQGLCSLTMNAKKTPHVFPEQSATVTSRVTKAFGSCDSFLMTTKPEQGEHSMDLSEGSHKGTYSDQNLNYAQGADGYCSSANTSVEDHRKQDIETMRRVHSEGRFVENLSDTLDAAWTGESHPTPKESETVITETAANSGVECYVNEQTDDEATYSLSSELAKKGLEKTDPLTWIRIPFLNFYHWLNRNSSTYPQILCILSEHSPVHILSYRDLVNQDGAKLLLPVGIKDTIVPVYDDEPTSIISYALISPDYHMQISGESERLKDGVEFSASSASSDLVNMFSHSSLSEAASESLRSFGSTEETILSLSSFRSSSNLDPLLHSSTFHARVSFSDENPVGKVKYAVTCYYAKQFEALRRICCPSEFDFIRSLSRCKKWGAQGGKSNVFFAKTLDDRFIIKQVTKTELESFIKFGPAYFKYLMESINTGSPTCLAKILGIYQVSTKQPKGGKESRMDVLVMENLLFRRNITRLYDLKGSSRSRYNPDSSGSNKVLLDQNLIEAMPTSPIFVGTRAKRLLERAVWNDTSFLASIDVMDYSLLVGVDEEKHELVLGIIDFMRQYTWDKHLETWVKASGILGGPKNASPTVISPKQYKKRFRKAMSAYFLMVPDQWSSTAVIPRTATQSDLSEKNSQSEPSS